MRSLVNRTPFLGILASILLAAGCGSNQGTGLLYLSISADPQIPDEAANRIVISYPGRADHVYSGSFPPKDRTTLPLKLQVPNLPASDTPVAFTVQGFDASGCAVTKPASTGPVVIKAGAETAPIAITLVKSDTTCFDGGSSVDAADGGGAMPDAAARGIDGTTDGADDAGSTGTEAGVAKADGTTLDASTIDSTKDTPESTSGEAGSIPDGADAINPARADVADAPLEPDTRADVPLGSGTGTGTGTGSGIATGGTPGTGGIATGGTPATGGIATGGTPATGGIATGGTPATGGIATGGRPATGGIATGGTPATGGAGGTGGGTGTGGTGTGGTGTGTGTVPVANRCAGVAATCGPSGDGDCCASLLVPGNLPTEMFYRSYDGVTYTDKSYPATVADFYLDKYEITVGRFRQFVEAGMGTQAMPPASGAGAHPLITGSGWNSAWNGSLRANKDALKRALNCDLNFRTWTDAALGNESRPQNCINWFEAFAFCSWDGGRLATEAEWNYAAAGGSEQREYPWGSGIDASKASYFVDSTQQCMGDGVAGCTLADLMVVGSKPAGNGKWGHADLAGNVWEWTLDGYATYQTSCSNCADLTDVSDRVTRGGHFDDITSGLRSAFRTSYGTGAHSYVIGARCARTSP